MNDRDLEDILDLCAFDGGSVKAIDDSGRFEGLAAPFGDHDLSPHRDRFDVGTDFGRALKSGVDLLYHHGLPNVGPEPNPLADSILGDAEFSIKADEGLWMKGQLRLAEKYERDVWEMVKAGKLKLSTGTAAHRVRREKLPDGTSYIKAWPVVEVSLTPTPAHPRTAVYALKSLLDNEEGDAPDLAFDTWLKSASDVIRAVSRFRKTNPSKRAKIGELRDTLDALLVKAAADVPAHPTDAVADRVERAVLEAAWRAADEVLGRS